MAAGRTNKEIGDTMNLTEGTVKVYLHTLMAKLGMHSRVELAWFLVREYCQSCPGCVYNQDP